MHAINDRYLLYKRKSAKDGGKLATIKIRNGDIEVDNWWVFPYLLLLSKHTKRT